MTSVLIISDTTIGKIIGKYIQSESLNVYHAVHLSTSDCGDERPNVIVVDMSLEPVFEETFCSEAFERYGCTSFVIVRPMEQVSSEKGSDWNTNLHIDAVVKPIRLAELKSLIYAQLTFQK